MKECQQKCHFRQRFFVGVPTAMNADKNADDKYLPSVGESRAEGALLAPPTRRRLFSCCWRDSSASFSRAEKQHVIGATSRGAVFVASCC
jgi:hypothetical protein